MMLSYGSAHPRRRLPSHIIMLSVFNATCILGLRLLSVTKTPKPRGTNPCLTKVEARSLQLAKILRRPCSGGPKNFQAFYLCTFRWLITAYSETRCFPPGPARDLCA